MAKRQLVCVVDDDDSVREALPDLLASYGFDTESFSSAEAFLASDSVAATRCLVLDVAMPGMTGPELQTELARLQVDIAIVFITAHADPLIEAQVLQHGACAFLLKPFTETAIVEAVNAALARG
ncbi:response regulator [Phenylobacterium sp.]|uniref:response regulator n=1 Tax=Phenylobacterium sp. TaxID=1871053 RepID=UPI0025DE26A1|nr:response regulator [Phenylobacterium sp.]